MIKWQELTESAIAAALRRFEAKYHLPSSRLEEAFRDPDGVLRETDDFIEWSDLLLCQELVSDAEGRMAQVL